MKKATKLFSILLSVIIIFSSLPISTMASSNVETQGHDVAAQPSAIDEIIEENDETLTNIDQSELNEAPVTPDNSESLSVISDSNVGLIEEFPDNCETQAFDNNDYNTSIVEGDAIEDDQMPEMFYQDNSFDLNASSPEVYLSKGYYDIKKGVKTAIKTGYNNIPNKRINICYGISNNNILSAVWGSVSGNRIDLYLTGKAAGTCTLTITIMNASNSSVICKKSVTVNVHTASISSSASSISLTKGSSKSVNVAITGYTGKVVLKYSTTNTSAIDGKWGNPQGNSNALTLTGKNVGSATIVIYLIGYYSDTVLASETLTASVSSTPKLTLSADSVSCVVGQSKNVKITYSNVSGSVYYNYSITNANIAKCSWLGWSNSTNTLKIDAKSRGSAKITVRLMSSSTNKVLATKEIFLYISQPTISLSASNVSVDTGKTIYINVTPIGMSGNYQVAYSNANNGLCACAWGKFDGKSIPIYIKGANAGSSYIYVYIIDTNGNRLASAKINYTVKQTEPPKIFASTTNATMPVGSTLPITMSYTNANYSVWMSASQNTGGATSAYWTDWKNNTTQLIVKGEKPGSGTIKVSLIKTSNSAVVATITINIKVENSGTISISNISYGFNNFSGAASERLCNFMYKNSVAKSIFNQKLGYGGNCFGMASTSGMFYVSGNGVNVNSFNSSKSRIGALSMDDRNNSLGITVKEFAQCMQISQVANICDKKFVSTSDLSKLYSNAESYSFFNRPLMIIVRGTTRDGGNAGHAITALGTYAKSSTERIIYVYDNNRNNQIRELKLTLSNGRYTGWSYDMGSHGVWGTGKPNASIGYVTYDNYLKLWNNRGKLTDSTFNLLFTNTDDYQIIDYNDNVVAKVDDGKLETLNDDIKLMDYVQDVDTTQTVSILQLPIDLYTVVNTDPSIDKFEVDLVNEELGVSVICEGNEVMLCADDDCNLNSAILTPDENEEYSISLLSSRKGETENYTFNGVGTGETISMCTDSGELKLCNIDSYGIIAGDENDGSQGSYTIKSSVDGNGEISNLGESAVLANSDIEYTITPNANNKVVDVIVDGESIGKVNTYTFKNIDKNHTIKAIFEEKENTSARFAKAEVTKTFGDSTFKNDFSTDSNENVTYTSSNTKVARVDSSGKVTIIGAGSAKITANVAEGENKKSATASYTLKVNPKSISGYSVTLKYSSVTYDGKEKKPTVTVKKDGKVLDNANYSVSYSNNKSVGKATVKIIGKGNYNSQKGVSFKINPKSTSISKLTAKSKGFNASWKKQTTQTTGYQLQIATDSNFKKGVKSYTISKNSTTSKNVTKLKSKKKYYARVRTYKTVSGTKYYSSWSGKKSITTKR